MKRLTDIFLLLCLVLAAVSCKDSGEERSHVLKIYNWADYIDEDVLAEFPAWYKQQTGEDIRLIYQVFDINEIMLTKIERGHEDFDVVCPSEYIIERMLKKDLLLPIDRNFGKTPDYLPNISPYIRRELNKTSQPGRTTTDYAVPYMWGTAGILYNRNFITPDEAGSWHCLWNSKNKGKILMKDSYRDAYGTAIIYAHARQLADSTVTVEQLMNDNSPEAIALAEKYLKAMKPNIAGWEADFGKETRRTGRLEVSARRSPRGQRAQAEGRKGYCRHHHRTDRKYCRTRHRTGRSGKRALHSPLRPALPQAAGRGIAA